MHHRSLLILLTLAACNNAGGNPSLEGGDTEGESDDADDNADEGNDEGAVEEGGVEEGGVEEGGVEEGGNDDGGPEVEHALGVITLSESHVATGGSASGYVSAIFMPDSAMGLTACTENVAGCRISIVPDCPSGCGDGQYCGFADGCTSACVDVCDATCDDDEVCYFAAPGQAACRDIEHFDAGSLTFTGTTTPITLFPPYVAEGFESGAPFIPGSEVGVSASGSAAAGFDAFEANFGTTTLLQGELDEIAIGEAYGNGDMPVHWSSGTDDVTISVTVTALDGSYGTVTCELDDTAGSFDVPRDAILAAVGGETPSNIAVTLTRTRTEVVEDLATKGELLYAEVKPVGWLELTTASSESHVIVGCAFGEALCGGECVDVLWDPHHCGGCNDTCNGECYNGECWAENTNATCSDGDDNDNDGYYDCEDFDCTTTAGVDVCDAEPENTNARCDDGDDNDGDGYIDCEDFDCADTTPCAAAEESGGDTGGADSCVGLCGSGAETCYCDAACVMYNDCCPDYDAVC